MIRVRLTAFLLAASMTSTAVAWATPEIAPILLSSITRTASRHAAAGVNPLVFGDFDCRAGDAFVVPLEISDAMGTTLQVWTGFGDCTPTTARGIGVAATCGLLYESESPVMPHQRLELPVGRLTSALRLRGLQVPTADCTPPESGLGLHAVYIFFMLVREEGIVVDAVSVVALYFNPSRPEPPTNIISQPVEEGALRVRWEQRKTPGVAGYYIFCRPSNMQLSSTSGDASVACSAVDEATSQPSAFSEQCGCSSAFQGQTPDPALLERHLCGEIYDADARSAVVTGLEVGTAYEISVSAVDGSGNPSALASSVCGPSTTPEELVKACSVRTPTQSSGVSRGGALLLLVLGSGLARARSIRRRARGIS